MTSLSVNATGQVPVLARALVDNDTPESAKTRTGFDGQKYTLVYSDEFEEAGRTFYPGDDPYLEAMDFWYGVTGDLEWYDPQQVSSKVFCALSELSFFALYDRQQPEMAHSSLQWTPWLGQPLGPPPTQQLHSPPHKTIT